MTITWDENKSSTNKAKHKVSFELARFVFDDPLHISQRDRIVDGEERWQAVGLVPGTLLLLVVHTWADYEGEEYIRIISARNVTKTKRKDYESNT